MSINVRRIMTMITVLGVCLCVFAGCSANINVTPEMSGTAKPAPATISVAKLTPEEESILSLMGKTKPHGRIFDYVTDETIKSMHVNIYILDENLQWNDQGAFSSEMKSPSGRIAVDITDDDNLRIVSQNKTGTSSYKSDGGGYALPVGGSMSTSSQDSAPIVYEEEIPLMIMISTTSNVVKSGGVESFYDTDMLKGHDMVTAITVTFSQKDMSDK